MVVRHPLFLVREGQIVRQDGPRSWRPLTKSTDDAAKMIGDAAKGDVVPYVYDVDGVEARAAQFGFFQKLEQAHAAPWIHSGCRTPEDAMDTFFAGAEALTIELRHMDEKTFDELATIAEGEIHLGIELGPKLPRTAELARLVNDYQLAGVVFLSDSAQEIAKSEFLARDLRALGASTSLVAMGNAPVPARVEALLEHVILRPEGPR